MLRGKPLIEKELTPLAFALQLSGAVPCFPSPEMPLPHPQGDQGGDSLESEGPEPGRAGGRRAQHSISQDNPAVLGDALQAFR